MVLSPRSAPLFGRAEKTEQSTGAESERNKHGGICDVFVGDFVWRLTLDHGTVLS